MRSDPSFGELLRSHRGAAKLTQEALADRSGLSVEAISMLERGVRQAPRTSTVAVLADAFGLDPDGRRALAAAAQRQRLLTHPSDAETATVKLDAAQGLLDSLPLDAPPEPGPLPAGSRMLVSRNPLFVGRSSDLQRLAGALKAGGAVALGQVLAATGMGGLGKTQLAVEFVHRYGRYFTGGVFWLSFANAEEVPLQVAACGGPGFMDLSAGFNDLRLEEKAALVFSAWQSELPRLLVFDNCEDEALLARWRPPSGGCRVLVTARRSRWDTSLGVRSLAVDVLPRSESVELLRRFRPDLPAGDATLDSIAHEVGDLPLALHLAGSFLDRYRAEVSPEDYVSQLRERRLLEHASLLGRNLIDPTAPTRHVLGVAQSFALSYQQLNAADRVDRTALALLARAAWLAPGEPVSRELLLRTLEQTDELEDRLLRADAVVRLLELGLLEASGESLRLHRLLAHFVRGANTDFEARAAVDDALIAFGRMTSETRLVSTSLLTVTPHMLHAAARALGQAEDERAAALCSAVGRTLRAGGFAAARPYLERALAIRQRLLGPEHLDIVENLTDLALLLQDQGELAAARSLLEHALAIRERLLDPDDSLVAASLNNLAMLLRDQGELAAARPLLERALEIRERTLGPDDLLTTTSLNNLAVHLQDLGEPSAARPLLERALAIRGRTLGPDHMLTITALSNLGLLFHSQGDLDAARPLLERGLAVLERALGSDHPYIAQGLNNLALLLQDQGDLAAARPLFERALALRERLMDPEHPRIATSLHYLGDLVHAEGELPAARSMLQRALTIREQALGPSHPHTAETLNSLGNVLGAQGEWGAARSLIGRALNIREQVLGPDHPQTAASLNDLALLLCEQGELDTARPLLERAVTVRERMLGPDHPVTAQSIRNLAILLRNQGQLPFC
jgi:tetratricopeptide (TPR) repeat protein/transcriptional regulator with XRE-family HTH domain